MPPQVDVIYTPTKTSMSMEDRSLGETMSKRTT